MVFIIYVWKQTAFDVNAFLRSGMYRSKNKTLSAIWICYYLLLLSFEIAILRWYRMVKLSHFFIPLQLIFTMVYLWFIWISKWAWKKHSVIILWNVQYFDIARNQLAKIKFIGRFQMIFCSPFMFYPRISFQCHFSLVLKNDNFELGLSISFHGRSHSHDILRWTEENFWP